MKAVVWAFHFEGTDRVESVSVRKTGKKSFVNDRDPHAVGTFEDEMVFSVFDVESTYPSRAFRNGEEVPVLRFRYTNNATVNKTVTECPPITLGFLRNPKFGWRSERSVRLNDAYAKAIECLAGYFGPRRHDPDIREAASRASLRVALATMKYFGITRIRNSVKENSALDSGMLVEMSVSGSPWQIVKGDGSV